MMRQWMIGLLVLVYGCGGGYQLGATGVKVATQDGYIWTYRVAESGKEEVPLGSGRAVLFYVSGSLTEKPRPVINMMGVMAGFVMLDIQTVLLDRRGVELDGSSDMNLARRSADKATRVADTLTAVRYYLAALPETTPVLLMGGSEGADIAAAVAAAEPRITHLLLLGGGGGMSQAEELKLLVQQHPEWLGVTLEELEAQYANIAQHPQAEELWLGQPFCRWSSFLWSPPLADLLRLSIPIFVGQGDADRSVPVESARALRDAFAAANKTNLRYVEYRGFNHSFQMSETGLSGLPMVELDILDWLHDVGLLSAEERAAFAERVRLNHPELFAH